MDYICPVMSFGGRNIGSAWLSVRQPLRNDLLTTLIQRYERYLLVQHLLKPPMALTVSGGFFLAVTISAGRIEMVRGLVAPAPFGHASRLLNLSPDIIEEVVTLTVI